MFEQILRLISFYYIFNKRDNHNGQCKICSEYVGYSHNIINYDNKCCFCGVEVKEGNNYQ